MQPVLALSCTYHSAAMGRLVSLLDFRTPHNRSRVAVAVAERSDASWRVVVDSDGVSPQQLPPAERATNLLRQVLQQQKQITQEVLHVFQATEIHTGLVQPADTANGHHHRQQQRPHRQRRHPQAAAASSSKEVGNNNSSRNSDSSSTMSGSYSSSSSSSSRYSGSSGSNDGDGEGPQPQRQRGLQGQVAQHLLSGNYDEAFLALVPPHTLNWVIKVLGQQGAVTQAEQLFHWMRLKGKASQFTFAKLCEAYASARQPWRALQAWRTVWRMPQAPLIAGPQAAAALVLGFRSTADYRGAVAALEALLDHRFPVNRYAFNAAIRVCADAKAADEALRLLARLRELSAQERRLQASQAAWHAASAGAAAGNSELRTDCRSYSAALAAVAAAGKWNRAAMLHRWMTEDGVWPDAPLCTQLLSCYAAVGQVAPAQQLVDAMLADPQSPPNRTHWNSLLLVYATARDSPGCIAAYHRMLGMGVRPDGYSMLALLRAAFHTQQGLAAVQAVQGEMARRRVQLNRQLGTAMLCCLRHVCPPTPPMQLGPEPASADSQPGQQQPATPPDQRQACLAEAAALFHQLRKQALKRRLPMDLRAYNSLLLVQLAAGDHAGVLQTFQELEGEEALLPDGTTLSIVISACRAAGWRDKEEQYRRLLEGSRLLGALRGDDDKGGGQRQGEGRERG